MIIEYIIKGAIVVAIILCIVICICRRRCAKRRIREALQIQENYMGSSPKQSVNGIQQNGMNNNNNNNNNNKLDTGVPIMNMKSVSMHNVAEDSDDDDDDDEIGDDFKHETQQNTENNSSKINGKKKKKKKRARMLDLSSDVVVENDENQNGNISSTNRKYKSKHYGKKDGGSTPIIMDSSIKVQSTETLSTTMRGSSLSAKPIGHGQQVSFVLDDDIDYYAQVQQMQSNPSDISHIPRSRGGSKINGNANNNKNNDIIDDDDDEDVEFDYGQQI